MRADPIDAARAFVDARFSEARGAIVAGSVIRGDATPTSDLDIALVIDRPDVPFRASYRFMDWPIEAFVHSEESLPRWMRQDTERRRPSLCKMCAEGVVLRDEGGIASAMKVEAQSLLDRGPTPPTPQQLEDWRYRLTDILDDFLGAAHLEEGMFIANDLAVEIANLTLMRNGRWLGAGKWIPRALRALDPDLTARLTSALEMYYRAEDKEPLVQLAETTLNAAGGRLFEGYYRSAKR